MEYENFLENHGSLTNSGMDITRGVGTGLYRAPEVIEGTKYGTSADMFSLGIIIFEMWYPFPPKA